MIKRELYMQRVRPFMNTEIIKVIIGIRRCGKSVMMELIQEELMGNGVQKNQILTMNFESANDDRTKTINTAMKAIADLSAELNDKKIYCFFDEIQELNEWEKFINAIQIDYSNIDIYITGSNANLLSGELATYLGGRYVEIKIYPFSFAEVLMLLKENHSTLTEEVAFQQYLLRGGFPFLYNYPLTDDDCKQYIIDIFHSIILKDISQRNKVRDIDMLEQMIIYFMANIGNSFSATSISKYLKNQRRNISTETLYNYLNYCQSACMLYLAKRQDLIGKTILETQGKIYLTDHGVREAIYGNNMRDINQTLENIIFMELLRRNYKVCVGKMRNTEIDFVAEKSSEKIYIQVAYLLASEETVNREFGMLKKIDDNYPKYVLSLDNINFSQNGIIHKNIRDFLLER